MNQESFSSCQRETKNQKMETIEEEDSEINQEEEQQLPFSTSEEFPAAASHQEASAAATPSSLGNDEFINHRLIYATLEGEPRELKFKECGLRSALFSKTPEVTELDHPFFGEGHTSVKMVGSCDGVICVVLDGPEIFLWNPNTGDAKRLPSFGVEGETRYASEPKSRKMSYGFGYDETNDDYKVVGISCDSFDGGEYHVLAKIYSVRTNWWMRLDDFKDRICNEWSYLVNGRLHWVAGHSPNDKLDDMDGGQKILALDLAYEVCEKMEQPEFGESVFTIWSLGIMKGRLALCASCQKSNIDIWMMREYGVKESWRRVLTIPPYPCKNLDGGPFIKPVFASYKDARFLFLYYAEPEVEKQKQALFLCRRNNEMQMEIEYSDLEDLDGVEVYVKSSLSPDFPHGIRRGRR